MKDLPELQAARESVSKLRRLQREKVSLQHLELHRAEIFLTTSLRFCMALVIRILLPCVRMLMSLSAGDSRRGCLSRGPRDVLHVPHQGIFSYNDNMMGHRGFLKGNQAQAL